MPLATIVSFRLGGTDGVSVEAGKWAVALRQIGFDLRTVAGEGRADAILPGLAMHADCPPRPAELESELAGSDLVVVENLCSLPLNPAACRALAAVLAGRPALLHHHDLPWQRPHLASFGAPPDDPAWIHVTINELSRLQLAERGIHAVTLYNHFDTRSPPGRRGTTREAMGIAEEELLVLQPTRAIERKNVEGGLALAESLGATFWLLGPAEDGYGERLSRLISGAGTRFVHGGGSSGRRIAPADAYAACDAVVLPSTWEGFGNPALESAVHRKPLAIGGYPVATELARLGFEWFPSGDPLPLSRWLERPRRSTLDRNLALARSHFDLEQLPRRLESLLGRLRDAATSETIPTSVRP